MRTQSFGRPCTWTCAVVFCFLTGAAFAQLPDLKIGGFTLAGSTTDPQTLALTGQITVPVKNQGAGPAGAFVVRFFEDRNVNLVYDAGIDQILGSANVAGLAAGATQNVTANVSGVVLFRGNLVYAQADSAQTVAETNEFNNYQNSGELCTYQPPVGPFSPVLEWSWTSSSTLPNELNVMSTPAIIDITGDGVPDVVFGATASTGGGLVEFGHLRALSGDNGTEIFTVTAPGLEISSTSSVAAGDIDLDGLPEILACVPQGDRLICFENDGSLKWITAPLEPIYWGAPSIADLNHDGTPEIVIGRQVLSNAGSIIWTGGAGSGSNNGVGTLSVVADIDLDGSLDVVAGNSAYAANGTLIYSNPAVADASTAVANFDADPEAEIIVVGLSNVWCLEHTGAIKWGPVVIPGFGYGGPPTVADYDGDGLPEIGVAGASQYTVFEHTGVVKWSSPTQDSSSNRTGSSVFDFEGDGSAEVIYRDELFLRVYRGATGQVIFQTPMSSCTWHEYVLVADVDGDLNAEMVAVANNNCGFGPQRGVYVFGSATDDWVATRPIWNQFSYHITNVNDDGSIPQFEASSWLTPIGQPYNSYRQNVLTSGASPQVAPDLTASYLRFGCPSAPSVTARIGNGGAIGIGTALPVSFYLGNPASGGIYLGTLVTPVLLPPGYFVDLTLPLPAMPPIGTTFYVVADDTGGLNGIANECDETNNIHAASVPTCATTAVASTYGAGWPGTLGTPMLLASGAPQLGQTIQISLSNSRGSATLAIFLLGLAPLAQPTALGGTLLVDYTILSTTAIGPGPDLFPLAIPCNLELCGVSLYLQAVEYDPGATSLYSFSNGLQLLLGQ